MISKYWGVIRVHIRTKLEYRFNLLMGVLSRLIFFIALYPLWKLIYKTRSSIAGYSFIEMISYTLLAVLVSSLVATSVARDSHKKVKNGEISKFIIRPLNFIYYYTAASLGTLLVEFIISAILLGLLITFLPVTYIVTFSRITAFLVSVILANIIYTQLYIMVGIFAFWIKEAGFMVQMIHRFVRLFAGGYIPVNLFPIFVQKLLFFLPFSATIYFPVLLLTSNTLLPVNIIQTLMVQAVWVFVMIGVNKILWEKGIKNYEAVGI